MRRIAALLVAAVGLAIGGQAVFAQTIATINSASPSSFPAGSGDTVLTLTLRQSGTTRYNVCFYSGVANAPIAPSAYNFTTPSAVTYTLTVPGARFQTGGTAYTNGIYLTAVPTNTINGCNGGSQGISNTFSFPTTAASYTISSASPSSTAFGSTSATVTFTGSLPTFPSNGSGLGLCFYNGTSNAPLLPASQSGTSSATFTVPGASLTPAGTARVYLASATSTCTGANPGYSNQLAYIIYQNITGSSPSVFPAGGGATQVSLYGNFSGASANLCFYTGTGSSTTLIAASSVTSYQITFTVPANSLSIPPSAFNSSGIYNAKVYFAPVGTTCNGTSTGISNSYNPPVSYPQLTSTSIATIPQVNSALTAYTPLPSKLDLLGSSFSSFVYGTFTPNTGSAATQGSNAVINAASAPVAIPSLNPAATSTAVNVCNYNGTYTYCATTPTAITNYPLASTSTAVASSVANPAPSQSTNLTATITPGASSTTAGGTFVPGPPTGTVTFSDGTASLGSATLSAGSLKLAPTATQQINIAAGTDSSPVSANSNFSTLTADFNQDGIPDTLLIQSNTGVFHLFLGGSPLGTIQAEQTILPGTFFGCSSLSGVTVADVNNDGYPDLAYLCGDSSGYSNLLVNLNQKDGTFSSATQVANDTFNQVAAADVNKDGKIDLVVSGNYGTLCCTGQTYGIRTYLGNGDGTFTSGTLTTTTDIPGTQVQLRDLNNDGIPDLTYLHYNTQTSATEVTVWQGNGTGGFSRVLTLPVCNCTVTKTKLFVTPFGTAATYPSILVFYQEASQLLAFVNKGTSTIAFTTLAPALYSNLTDVVIGDFTRDGLVDVAHYNGTDVSIEVGNGAGLFALNNTLFAPYTFGTGTANAVSLAATSDLNGDGYADLLAIFPTATSTTSTIQSLVSTGTAAATLPATFTAGSHPITTAYSGNLNELGSAGSLPLAVGKTTPTINWSTPAATTTTTPVASILNAAAVDPATGAAVAGSFAYTYTPANGTYLSAGTQALTATFTPTNTTNYNSATATRSITVNKVTPTINTTISPGNHTYQPDLATNYAALIVGSNVTPTGTVQFSNNGSALGSPAGIYSAGSAQVGSNITFSSLPAGNFSFTATYNGDSVYNAVTSTATAYTVAKAAPTLTYSPTPSSITYGTALAAAQLTATAADPNTAATIPGNFTYSAPGSPSLFAGFVLPAGSNVVTAAFTPNDSNYNSTSTTSTITVAKAATTTNVTVSPTAIPLGQVVSIDVTVTPSPNSTAVTGTVTFTDDNGTIPNPQVTLNSGSAFLYYTPTNPGTHHISAAYTPTANYIASSSATPATFTVSQKTPTVTYSPSPISIPYGTALAASQLNATAVDPSTGAAVPGSFAYTTPAGTVSPGAILPAGSNTLTATFTPTDTTTYTTATQSAVITVVQAAPTVTYNASPASIPYGTALAASLFSASASVPGTFTYNPTLGTVLPVGSRTVTLTFIPTDTTNYANVTRTATVTVTQATPTVAFSPNPATLPYGTPLSAAQLDATQTTAYPGAFTYSPALGAILPVGPNTITATFTPTDTTNVATVTKTAVVTVTQATPVLTFTPNPTTNTTTPIDATLLNATTTIPGVFTYTPALGAFLPVGPQTLSTTFTPTDTLNYATVTQTATTTVAKTATTAVLTANPGSLSAPGTPTVLTVLLSGINITPTGNVQFLDTATGSGNSGVILLGASGVTAASAHNAIASLSTILGAGSHSLSAIYNGDPVYLSATSSALPYSVGGSAVPITFTPSPATIPYGTPLSASQLDATAPIPGAFTYSPALGAILSAGLQTITATFTPTDLTNYQVTTQTAAITVTQTTPTLTFTPSPASIPYGTPLSAAQLDATSNIPGVFTYTPTLNAILPVGANTVTGLFTPTDTLNYTTATQTAIVTVTSVSSALTLTLTANNAPAVTIPSGAVLTLTATLATPVNGQVNFCDASAPTCTGANLLGSAQLTAAGTATYRFIPAIGSHTYKAVFLGTKTSVASTSAAAPLIVTGTYPTVTTLTATGSTGAFTLTAVVTATGSPTATPTGLVSFLDTTNANAPLATAPLANPTTTQTFPTQTTPSGLTGSIVLTADFNNDGIPDLISETSVVPATFSMYLGNGDGTFALKSILSVQGANVVVGDFNRDNVLDLAVLSGKSVVTLLGNGDGTFSSKSSVTIAGNSSLLFAADFDRDGLLDLYSQDGTVLIGAGDGTFQALQNSAASVANAILVDDFDGDGVPDLIATSGGNPATYLGRGDGTFTLKSTISLRVGSILASTDLNGDGKIDLIAVNYFDNSVSTLLGGGDGSFTLKSTTQNPIANLDGSNSYNLSIADFNRDSIPDLAVIANDGVFIYTSKGDGTFTVPSQVTKQTPDSSNTTYFYLTTVDLNNDGLPDLAVTASSSSGSNVTLARNTFTATATAVATNIAPTGAGSHLVTASYPGDNAFASSTSAPVSLTGATFTPILTWTPAPLTFGSPLSAAQLNAVATTATGILLPGTFTYAPAAGGILPVGRQTLSVTFTPTDLVTYTPATLTTTVLVNPLATATTLTSSLNPAAFRQTVTLTATVTPAATIATPITGTVDFFDATTLLGSAPAVAGVATLPISTLSAAIHTLSAVYTGDTAGNFTASTSPVLTQTVTTATPILTFAPSPATILYGTRLTSAQLSATARTATGTAIPGTFTYTPAAGAILPAGPQILSVTFIPTDTTRYATVTATAALTVTRATPTLVWPTPANVPVGTALSATQLNATATGIDNAALPGTFTYTPAAGTLVTSGPQTLSVLFSPTDTVNYTTASATITLNGTAVTLTALSANTANLGDPAKTITLTGTGFATNSVARANGAALPTTYVSATTLTATLPAARFTAVQTLQITVNNPTQNQTTAALPFTVVAPLATPTITGPATITPNTQPTIAFALTTPYPVDITGTFTLTFTPVNGSVADPAVQFATGGTTFSATVPAGQTTIPNLLVQSGTVAGTIRITLALTAGGVDVTPSTLAPLVITIPSVAPTITSVTLVRSGRQLTVRTVGFSNTREVTKAIFHFTAANGQQINTPDVTIDVSAIFAGWYSQTASAAYGSTFLYTQVFNLDDDAAIVGQVTVSLSNGIGASASGSSQ